MSGASRATPALRPTKWKAVWRGVMKNKDLYPMMLPALIYILIFKYGPMYGVTLAFKQFVPGTSIWDSPWVGFDHFIAFFQSFQFARIMENTIALSLLQILIAFPAPIILALLMNQCFSKRYARIVQTVLYIPHLISMVVLVGMLMTFMSPSTGMINNLIRLLGGESVNFFGDAKYFRGIYIGSEVWKNIGWNAIIYLAALSGVSLDMHEAAVMDGANKFQRIWYIDLPSIMPMIMIMLIMSVGRLMNISFEKAFLMQNDVNIAKSEIISTHVYKLGLRMSQYDYSTAIGLFNNVINVILLVIVNSLSRKFNEAALW